MSIALGKAGIHGVYHDIKDSSAAQFAEFRQQLYLGTCDMACTREGESLIPVAPGSMEAIIAIDWLDRVSNASEWLHAINDRLRDGGLLFLPGAVHPTGDGMVDVFSAVGDGWWRKAMVEVK